MPDFFFAFTIQSKLADSFLSNKWIARIFKKINQDFYEKKFIM